MRIIIWLLLGIGLLAIITKKPLPAKRILPAKMNMAVKVKIDDKWYFLLRAPVDNGDADDRVSPGCIWVIQRQ